MAAHLCTILCVYLSYISVLTDAALSIADPLYLETTRATYKERGNYVLYPGNVTVIPEASYKYFSSKMDFETVQGKILIGGADKLYLFNQNLSLSTELTWESDKTCDNTNDNPGYVCRNHIRVYEEIPENIQQPRSLLVCGTQSSVQSECSTVGLMNTSEGVVFGTRSGPSNVTTGLISAHPDLPGFGEFRRSSPTDTMYFSASFTSSNTREYDLAYLNVDLQNSTGLPSATREYGWILRDTAWLNYPVVFVDYSRANYPAPGGSRSDAYQFYFVFLRESVQDIVYSRVVRICRNDPGVSSVQDPKFFSTFLKARIFCEREMPPGTEFVGSQDFQFNEIWSLSFNGEGRYHSEGDYVKLMYGAFSGPLIGPPGTAICVYPAYPTMSDFNQGIFDIFQEDVAISGSPQLERQNNFVECAPSGRNNSNEAKDIRIVQDVRQIGENPLFLLDGFHVSQMVVDEVCVVRNSNSSQCVNQDVLFLGTDTGLIYKVVVSTSVSGASGTLEPVIVDEIKLDDTTAVNEMKIEYVDAVKHLFVSTSSRIYRLPLESCSRFSSNFTSCIASRDPYCVWNSVNITCERTSLAADSNALGAVPQFIRQNIHTGTDEIPEVRFTVTSLEVSENAGSFSIVVSADSVVSDNVLELVSMDGTARSGLDYILPPNPIDFPSGQTSVTVIVTIISDLTFTLNKQFSMMLRSTGSGSLSFRQDVVNVVIIDEQAILFQITLGGLSQLCEGWIKFESSTKINLIESAVLDGLQPGSKLDDVPDLFRSSGFNCSDKLSVDRKEFVVYRSALDLTKLPNNVFRTSVLNSLVNWINGKPSIKSDDDDVYQLSVILVTSCETSILFLDSPLCDYNGVTVGDTGGLVQPTSAPINDNSDRVLGAFLGLSIIVNIGFFVLVGVVVVFLCKKRRCYEPRTVGVAVDNTDGVSKETKPNGDIESSGEEPPKSTSYLMKTDVFTFSKTNENDTNGVNGE